jgi:hypothetical protein
MDSFSSLRAGNIATRFKRSSWARVPSENLPIAKRVPQGRLNFSIVQISLEAPADFISQPRSLVLDGCPMFAPAYMGRKRIVSNAFTPCKGILALRRSLFCARSRSVGRGLRPSFSAHVRRGEHGAPVQGNGPCCLLKGRAAHLFIGSVLTQPRFATQGRGIWPFTGLNTRKSTHPLIWTAHAELSPGRSPISANLFAKNRDSRPVGGMRGMALCSAASCNARSEVKFCTRKQPFPARR